VIVEQIKMHRKAAWDAFSAALVIIGVLALYNRVLSPHVGYLHAMQRYGSVVDRVVEERDRISSTLDTKVSQWRSLQREMTELDEGVFTKEQAKTWARGLLPLVEDTGCVVVLADFGGDGKADRTGDGSPNAAGRTGESEPNTPVVIRVSHVSLEVAGRPEQISVLLQRLRDHRPRIWIDSCRLGFSEGDGTPVEGSLVLTLYSIGSRKEPADG